MSLQRERYEPEEDAEELRRIYTTQRRLLALVLCALCLLLFVFLLVALSTPEAG